MRMEAVMNSERYTYSKSGLVFALPVLIIILYFLLTI